MEFRKRVLHPGAAIGLYLLVHDEVSRAVRGHLAARRGTAGTHRQLPEPATALNSRIAVSAAGASVRPRSQTAWAST